MSHQSRFSEPKSAFYGQVSLKQSCLEHVRTRGIAAGWEYASKLAMSGVGTIYGRAEVKLGIPRLLARLLSWLDINIAECDWAYNAVSAIELGADLSPVWSKFAQWLLSDEDYGLCKIAWRITDAEAVRKVSALYHQADATLQDWQKLVSSLPETHSEGDDYIRKAAIEFAYIGWALAVSKVEATESSVGYALDQAANHAITACELTAAAFQAKEEAMLIQAAKLVEIIESIPGRAPLASPKRASDHLHQPGKDFPNSRQ
jgi:hypothetical protein